MAESPLRPKSSMFWEGKGFVDTSLGAVLWAFELGLTDTMFYRADTAEDLKEWRSAARRRARRASFRVRTGRADDDPLFGWAYNVTEYERKRTDRADEYAARIAARILDGNE